MKPTLHFIVQIGLIFCMLIISVAGIYAQFSQKGVTLEYNRRQAKTPYTSPVELRFEGASTTNNTLNGANGSFVLQFDKAHAGDTIKGYDIIIGNQKYILFNKDKIKNWNLSSQAKLEIVVCPKELINYLEKTYSENQINQLKQRYNKLKAELQASVEDAEDLRKQLTKLDKDYKNEINYIKARAVLFAYVDETQIDSLESLRREAILTNNFERATQIGKEMNLVGVSNSTIENYRIAKSTYNHWVSKLEELSVVIEDHVQNCLSTGEPKDSLASYYMSLVDIYKSLLEEYKDIKSKETSYEDTKKKLGNLLFFIADNIYWFNEYNNSYQEETLYIEAANLCNSNALWHLATTGNDRINYQQKKEYAHQLLNNVEYLNAELPEYIDRDGVRNYYESFPDFGLNTKMGIMYYHIIADNEVSLTYYQQIDTMCTKVKIPASVQYNGRNYKVTKIGNDAFHKYMGVWWGESNTPNAIFMRDSSFCENYSFLEEVANPLMLPQEDTPEGSNILDEVILPNTVRYVGEGAFLCASERDYFHVNIPKGIKKIRDRAFSGVNFDKGVVNLPEGIEEIDNICEGGRGPYTFYIPSTLKDMHDTFGSIHKYSPDVKSIIVSPKNKHYRMIQGNLYSFDKKEIYIGSLYNDYTHNDQRSTLYITKECETDLEYVFSDFYSPLQFACIDSVVVEKENQRYFAQDGVLYDKKEMNCLLKPYSISEISIPSFVVKNEPFGEILSDVRKILIPNNLSLDFTCELFSSMKDTITVRYYQKEKSITSKKDVIPFIKSVLKENPKSDSLKYLLGTLYLNSYDIRSSYDILFKTNWSDSVLGNRLIYLYRERVNERDSLFAKLKDANENDDYNAQSYLYSEMIKFWECYTEEDDIYFLSRLYNWRGIAYRMIGEYTNSQDSYEKAIQVLDVFYNKNPWKYKDYISAVYSNMAIGYSDQNSIDMAFSYFEKSLSVNPQNVNALEGLGIACLEKQDIRKAKDILKQIVDINNEYQNNGYLKQQIEKYENGTRD